MLPMLLVSTLPAVVMAAGIDRIQKKSGGLDIVVRPHTRPQMAAFYEARGFPAAALGELEKACFMTVSVINLRKDIVWLEPARWQIRDNAGQLVQRLNKAYWDQKWQQHRVSAAARTAFRWTQLPESRDLRPEEPVGGNIAFIPKNGPFSLLMRFPLGAGKTNGEVKIRLPGLGCPDRH